MGAFRPFLFLLIIVSTPVHLYIVNRKVCPVKNDVCHYYENPNLEALFRDAEAIPALVSRNPFFFADETPNRDHIMKNIKYDYLDVDKNFDDFMEMDSEEIGTLGKATYFKQKPIPWKMDEMQAYIGGPKVLPDVMIMPDTPIGPTGPQILSDDEIKLGRFVVNDYPNSPQIGGDMIQQEKFLTYEAEDMGDDEINERYLKVPRKYRKPPTVVFNKVVKASESKVPSREYLDQYYRHALVTPSPDPEEHTIEKTPTADQNAYYSQDHFQKQNHHIPAEEYFEHKYIPQVHETDPYHPSLPQEHFLPQPGEYVDSQEEMFDTEEVPKEESLRALPQPDEMMENHPINQEEESSPHHVLEEPIEHKYYSTTPTTMKTETTTERCDATPGPTTPNPLETSTSSIQFTATTACPPPEIHVVPTTCVPETNTKASIIEGNEQNKTKSQKKKRRKRKKKRKMEEGQGIANRVGEPVDNLFEGLLSVM